MRIFHENMSRKEESEQRKTEDEEEPGETPKHANDDVVIPVVVGSRIGNTRLWERCESACAFGAKQIERVGGSCVQHPE